MYLYNFMHASYCIMGALKLLWIAYSWLCQFLDHLNFLVGDDVKVADNVVAIPLILLFDGWQHILGVVIVVIVSAEQPALPAGGLIERKVKQGFWVEKEVYFVT